MSQFKRKCAVTITTGERYIVIEGLRITFNVEKGITENLDKTEINIYNLSKNTRDLIDDVNKQVYLNVGYDTPGKELSRLAQGDLRLFRHHFEPPNVVTRIEIDDGEVLTNKEFSLTSKENTTYFKVIEKISDLVKAELEVDVTSLAAIKKKLLPSGYSFSGKLKEAMHELSECLDADWSTENGNLRVITRGESLPGFVLLIDETSGMIGTPEKIDDINTRTGKQKAKNRDKKAVAPGYIVTTLLNPSILIGHVIHLKSKKLDIDGEYIVNALSHRGDTHGNDWFTKAKVLLK